MANGLNKKKVSSLWANVKHGALKKAGWSKSKGAKGVANTPANIKRLNFLANFSGDPATKAKARAAVNRMKASK